MAEALDVVPFLERSRTVPVLDVRTPAEYAHAHIPGAHSLPLFSDEERTEIGTLYRHEGRRTAMLQGLDLVGPKMRRMVEEAGRLTSAGEVLVHCWRGGMRSESTAWLLQFFGYRVAVLEGGYKAFRHYVLDAFERRRPLCVLSGATGSGKTDVLHALRSRGEQVLDLEGLAHHKGSVFGGLGEPPQPSQEHFENRLALHWSGFDPSRPVWVEDESRRIGGVGIPEGLWQQMQAADAYVLEVPLQNRVDRLVELYGGCGRDRLAAAVRSIERRLGGLRTKQALVALDEGDLSKTCAILLDYYDRAYRHALSRRNSACLHIVNAPEAPTTEERAEALCATLLRS